MINRYNSIIILLTIVIFLLVLSIFKINKVIHNTDYAQIENDSLKNVIITNNLENDKKISIYKKDINNLQDSILDMVNKYKKDSVFYINLYQMNWENVCFFVDYFKIKHPEIVKSQILLETNYLKSEACQINKNLFGMKYVKGRLSTHEYKKFAHYNNYVESIMEYKMWQDFYYKNNKEDYFVFLKRIGYAPNDRYYNHKLRKIIKTESVKNKNNFSKKY